MATAQDLIVSALRKCAVVGAGETPSTDELNAGLLALQALAGNWSDGIGKALAGLVNSGLFTYLGLETYPALTTVVTSPASIQRALIFNLAVDLAAEFGRTLPAEIAAAATQSKTAVCSIPGVI